VGPTITDYDYARSGITGYDNAYKITGSKSYIRPSGNYESLDIYYSGTYYGLNSKSIPLYDWNNYPTKQIEMLYDIMGISEEEILEWYLDNIQMDDVITAIKNGIKNRICLTKKPEVVETINTTVTIDEYDAKAKTIKPKKVTKSKK
jgi:hypothetical protein